MKTLFSTVIALLLCLSDSAHGMDLGTVLGVEVDHCASNFADENADGIIDAADNVTAIGRPVVGVIEVALDTVYRFGPAISIQGTFNHDLPTTLTRTVRVPPVACFLPPVPSVQHALPTTTLDVGTTGVLTMAGMVYPLIVHPAETGTWRLQQNYVGDFEKAPATIYFPGGADVTAFEVPIERHLPNNLENADLSLGPHVVNYRRMDLPLILNFGSTAQEGVWERIELQRTGSDAHPSIVFEGQMPALGSHEVPSAILEFMDQTPNLLRLIRTTIRERIIPVEMTDGSPASVVVRYTYGSYYSYAIYPIIHPVVETVQLNLGSEETTRTDVAIRFDGNSHFMDYQLSLSPNFDDGDWVIGVPNYVRPTYIESTINIPATPGDHTVYIRIRNERGTSETATATIRYVEPVLPKFTGLTLLETNPIIYRRGTWMDLSYEDEPTQIRISRLADFSDAEWMPLSSPTIDGTRRYPYTITGPNGIVTLHVQLRNDAGESNVMTTSIEMIVTGG